MSYIPGSLSNSPSVTATGTITIQNSVPAGTATANSAVEITLNGNTTLSVQTTGTYTGALSLQVTVDGTNWITLGGIPFLNINTGVSSATIVSATQGIFQTDVAGATKARITALAAVTGTATVTLRAVSSAAMVALDAPLPTGANTLGAVTISGTPTVTANLGTGGTGATSLGKARDAAAAGTDTNIGIMAIRTDTLATVTPAVGDYEMLRLDSYGRLYINNQTVTILNPGFTIFKTTALTSTVQQIKATTGNIFGFNFINPNTVPIYVKIYGVPSASVTVGTTVPDRLLVIPAADAVNPGSIVLSNDETAFYNGATGLSIFATSVLSSVVTQTAPSTAIYAEVIYA